MPITYDEFSKREKNNKHYQAQQFEYIKQAAVNAEYLTGNEYWDKYVSYIQAKIEEMRDILDQLMDKLADPNIVDHNHIMSLKLSVIEAATYIKAWEAVITLPKDLIENGKITKEIIDD